MRFTKDIAELLTRMPSHVDGIYSEYDIEVYIQHDRYSRLEAYTIALAKERFEGWRKLI